MADYLFPGSTSVVPYKSFLCNTSRVCESRKEARLSERPQHSMVPVSDLNWGTGGVGDGVVCRRQTPLLVACV